ncbi:MAG: hypothetical protein V4640_11090 [Verrucomicrobiota bacterium]
MPLPPSVIETRAVKVGVKASKKRHHVVTEQELLALRVQVMPPLLRILLGIVGLGLLLACGFAWPSESNATQSLEAVLGVLFILFGAFGIRRTLSKMLENVNTADAIESILELIGEAVSSIDL